ncbi:hypothetical protein B0H14DRAFT_2591464 [Mycena olivaceomarginata]|nr:hypothetical protein B0H14DRAFT_2591464 [Mycena olivaceomarginata]
MCWKLLELPWAWVRWLVGKKLGYPGLTKIAIKLTKITIKLMKVGSRIQDNLFDYVRADGTTIGVAIIQTIDSMGQQPLNQVTFYAILLQWANIETAPIFREIDLPSEITPSDVIDSDSSIPFAVQ